MQSADILRLVPVWLVSLALAWGVNKGIGLFGQWREDEAKQLAIEATSKKHRRKILKEISKVSHDIEDLFLPIPVIAMTTGPEELNEFKSALKPRIEEIKFFDQIEHYKLKSSLFQSIDLAFSSAHENHSGWMQEVLMYTSLEMLRALNQLNGYYSAHDVVPSECPKFTQVQSDIRRTYEDSFESLARLRGLA